MQIDYRINNMIIDNINELIFQYQQLVDYVLKNKCEINMKSIRKMANCIIEIKKDIIEQQTNFTLNETSKEKKLLEYYRNFVDTLFHEDDNVSNLEKLEHYINQINEIEKQV